MHKNSSTKISNVTAHKASSKYQFIHKITECAGWKKLWDQALDYSLFSKAMKNLVRVISYRDQSSSKCPLCSTTTVD